MAAAQVYEQPLNERVRTFLKIETLSARLNHYSKQAHEWSSYNALLVILEITALIERSDIKQEVMKELERQQNVLKILAEHEGVDKSALELILSKLYQATQDIHNIKGKMGEHIKSVDFLLALKQRTTIPGGSCDFDLPELHFWLGLKSKDRLEHIQKWASPYTQLNQIIGLLLKIIRDSGHPTQVTAESGFYQESLDSQQSNQLLRLFVPKGENYYPEISAGKQRFSIRLLTKTSADSLSTQLKSNINLKLVRCVL